MEGDRERWNASWRDRAGELAPPARFLVEHEAHLPRAGRALDVAGGAGRNAVWLARRGLAVTMVDVSDVGLERAERRAEAAGVTLRLLRLDLDHDELPPGPFDVIVCIDFLDRAGRDRYLDRLAPGGVLVLLQATRTNLERHARPSARFLLDPGELDAWARATGLDVLASEEGWTDEGRHEAAVLVRRP